MIFEEKYFTSQILLRFLKKLFSNFCLKYPNKLTKQLIN